MDHFVALSAHVQKRIQTFYGREADVVYPPVNLSFWTPAPEAADKAQRLVPRSFSEGGSTLHAPGRNAPAEPGAPNAAGTYDLIVSALAPYKKIDLAVRAYNRLGFPLKIVGTGTEYQRLRRMALARIEFLGQLDDERIRNLYRHCRALIFPGEEDFGIVPVEAQACGRPVVAFGYGGARETVVAGQSRHSLEPGRHPGQCLAFQRRKLYQRPDRQHYPVHGDMMATPHRLALKNPLAGKNPVDVSPAVRYSLTARGGKYEKHHHD
ncbi:MAG: glycosyltransferase [Lentisphaerae bacterium]|nr:glycosyltransferase [Lentisphaerota bacterium]